MQEEEFIIAVVAVIFGTGLIGFVFARITSLIKLWITRKTGSGTGYDEELRKHFVKFKGSVEKRLAALEHIVTDEEELKEIQAGQKQIELPDLTEDTEEELKQLTNMLKQKSS